jgi:hypothetical protein
MFSSKTVKRRKDSPPSNSTSTFKYDPLDYTRGAIRLLRILPNLSDTGLIQCEMWHDQVTAAYDCLSYVWGSDKVQQHIIINGKPFVVQENLWNFLRAARTKYAVPPRTFWIDALCIDQKSIWEKNHQVAQMGSIYSNAKEVIAWIGLSKSIARAFAFGLEIGPDPGLSRRFTPHNDSEERWELRNKQTNRQLENDWLEVVSNRYWTRAWITQEIFLARRIKLLVNDMQVDPFEISGVANMFVALIANSRGPPGLKRMDPTTELFSTYFRTMCGARYPDQNLLTLCDRLPGRQSFLAHDRIYSLLSIATDGEGIPVDYHSSIDDVMLQLMHIYQNKMCICAWFFLVDMLDCRLEKSGKAPVLKIPMKKVKSEFVMGPDPKKWHEVCSSCNEKMSSFDPKETLSFCAKSMCEKNTHGHLYLRKQRNRNGGGKYTIRRHDDRHELDVVNVEVISAVSRDEIVLGRGVAPEIYNVSLTVDVLMHLFFYPKKKARPELPLRICAEAQRGNKRVEFHEKFGVGGAR